MRNVMNSQRRSIERAEADALYNMAHVHRERGELRLAFQLFLSAAKRRDPTAQHMVGYMYDVGEGTRKNRSFALRWYRKAYNQGFAAAASNIATIFRGDGDVRATLAWYERAARLRDGDANIEIAKIYLKSKKDPTRAMIYLKRAVREKPYNITKDGKKSAAQLLKRLTRKGRAASSQSST